MRIKLILLISVLALSPEVYCAHAGGGAHGMASHSGGARRLHVGGQQFSGATRASSFRGTRPGFAGNRSFNMPANRPIGLNQPSFSGSGINRNIGRFNQTTRSVGRNFQPGRIAALKPAGLRPTGLRPSGVNRQNMASRMAARNRINPLRANPNRRLDPNYMNRFNRQRSFFNRSFRGHPWSWWWRYRPSIFWAAFPVVYYAAYQEYPPVYDDYQQYAGLPVTVSQNSVYGPEYNLVTVDNTDPNAIQDCLTNCATQCLNDGYDGNFCTQSCNQQCQSA